MPRRMLVTGLLAVALIVVLAACSSAASSPSGGAASPAASVAASTAPSAAPAGNSSEPSVALPSLDIPSFALPSGAKDLEALLPNTICGATATKFSMGGADFAAAGSTPEFEKALQELGKTAADVSFAAAAGGGTGCTAGIFRVNGVEAARFSQVYLAAGSEAEGNPYTATNVNGKDVYSITTSGDATQYVYFNGDAVLFVQAKTADEAASILKDMP